MGPCVRRDDTYRDAFPDSVFQSTLLANTTPRSRRAFRARFGRLVPPSIKRAQGMPGARCARSRACGVENTRVSHHGHTGKRPAFPAQWFYSLYRALPGDRAFLPPSSLRSLLLKNLMPASGHQDHTTSPSASTPSTPKATPGFVQVRRSFSEGGSALVRSATCVHRIPPRVRDDREPPLCEARRGDSAFDLGGRSTTPVATD
jgi:hypothetical protein